MTDSEQAEREIAERIDAIREYVSKMTPGPWRVMDDCYGCKDIHAVESDPEDGGLISVADIGYTNGLADEEEDNANANGVAKLRTDAEWLIEQLVRDRCSLLKLRASHSWIKITDDPQTLPPQYSSWLLAHKDTGDGSPTVDEAQWDGEKWLLARSAPQDERIYIGEQAYAYMALPAPPPESQNES